MHVHNWDFCWWEWDAKNRGSGENNKNSRISVVESVKLNSSVGPTVAASSLSHFGFRSVTVAMACARAAFQASRSLKVHCFTQSQRTRVSNLMLLILAWCVRRVCEPSLHCLLDVCDMLARTPDAKRSTEFAWKWHFVDSRLNDGVFAVDRE